MSAGGDLAGPARRPMRRGEAAERIGVGGERVAARPAAHHHRPALLEGAHEFPVAGRVVEPGVPAIGEEGEFGPVDAGFDGAALLVDVAGGDAHLVAQFPARPVGDLDVDGAAPLVLAGLLLRFAVDKADEVPAGPVPVGAPGLAAADLLRLGRGGGGGDQYRNRKRCDALHVARAASRPSAPRRRASLRFQTGSPKTCGGRASTAPPGATGRSANRRAESSRSYITTAPAAARFSENRVGMRTRWSQHATSSSDSAPRSMPST